MENQCRIFPVAISILLIFWTVVWLGLSFKILDWAWIVKYDSLPISAFRHMKNSQGVMGKAATHCWKGLNACFLSLVNLLSFHYKCHNQNKADKINSQNKLEYDLKKFNTLASGCFQGFLEKNLPKRTWLCAGISLVLYGLRAWLKRQKTWQVF